MILIDAPFKVTKEEYLKKALTTRFDDDLLDIKLSEACDAIWEYIQVNSNGFLNAKFQKKTEDDKNLERIIQILKKAAILQMIYVESIGGDYRFSDGYSESSNSFVTNGEIRAKEIARPAIDLLSRCGLLYGGLY